MGLTKLFTDHGHKKSKRAGRGIAAGLGKTAGRGTKGQKSRTGSGRKIKAWFEGGQTPLHMKTAKRRGTNHNAPKSTTVTTDLINRFFKDGEVVSHVTLVEKKVIRAKDVKKGVKVVKRNPLSVKVTFDGVAISKSLQ